MLFAAVIYFNQHMFAKQVFLCFWMWSQTRSGELVRNMILHQLDGRACDRNAGDIDVPHFELWMRKLGNVCQWVAKKCFHRLDSESQNSNVSSFLHL